MVVGVFVLNRLMVIGDTLVRLDVWEVMVVGLAIVVNVIGRVVRYFQF